jgi:hypothetical protein
LTLASGGHSVRVREIQVGPPEVKVMSIAGRFALTVAIAAVLGAGILGAQTADREPALLAPPNPAPPAVPEVDFQRLCSGHVSAVPRADGRPGPHLEWTAYTSPSPVGELAGRHETALAGGEHETGEDGCHLWRFQDAGKHIWDLCPVEVESPARGCDKPPSGTRSVLLVSTMVGGD